MKAPIATESLGPTPSPWIVDEVNTPNGVSYEINHLWEDGEGITRTDTIAEVVMDYAGDRARCNANILAASAELLKAANRALGVLKAQGESVRPGNVLGALDAAISKAEGRAS